MQLLATHVAVPQAVWQEGDPWMVMQLTWLKGVTHAWPQAPQSLLLVERSTHWWPQRVWSSAQGSSPLQERRASAMVAEAIAGKDGALAL
jgi:hypothetical protein